MRPHAQTSGPDRSTQDEAIVLRASPHHLVHVTAEIEQAGSLHAFVAETLVTAAGPPVKLLSAVFERVELDLIGSVQRDGAISVTVTAQMHDGAPESIEEEEQSWSTVVPAGSSADFVLSAADGLAAGTEAHGTIHNRRIR